ncbi:MAG: hypothetical protein V4568_05265 [Pseudomonadota bacterium]
MDAQFPMLAGLLLIGVTILGWERFWVLKQKVFTLFFLHGLFVLTFPMYLAHLVADHDWNALDFQFDRDSYWRVVYLMIIGYLGILAAQETLRKFPYKERPPSKLTSYVTTRLNNCNIPLVIFLSFILYAASLAVTYKTGVGVTGYIAKPDIGLIYGFMTRIDRTLIPLVNLFIFDRLLEKKDKKMLGLFFIVVVVETGLMILVSLSRYALISYVLLPALMIWLYQRNQKTAMSPLKMTGLMIVLVIVVSLGVAIADIARKVVFFSLITGQGYQAIVPTENLEWNGLMSAQLLNGITFYERLSGAREFIWVDTAIGASGSFMDTFYSVVMGPPDNDPNYIVMRVLGFIEEVNDDTGFGTGLNLMANFRFGGEEFVIFFGMMAITLFFIYVERVVRRITPYDSIILYFVSIVVINMWQGDALNSVFRRPIQMCVIGVVFLVIIGAMSKKPSPNTARVCVT